MNKFINVLCLRIIVQSNRSKYEEFVTILTYSHQLVVNISFITFITKKFYVVLFAIGGQIIDI
jgi:hypothetical protein